MFLLFVKINRACLFPINEFGHKQTNKMSPEKRINWTIRLSLFKNNKKVHSEHSMQVFLWWVLRLDSIIDRINNNDNEESKKRQIYIWFYAKISMEIVSLLFFFLRSRIRNISFWCANICFKYFRSLVLFKYTNQKQKPVSIHYTNSIP